MTSRWQLQITDFGLHELRSNAEDDDSDEENPSVCTQKNRKIVFKSQNLALKTTHIILFH